MTKTCRENLNVKIMTDIYIYRERERKTEFLGLADLSSMKYFKT